MVDYTGENALTYYKRLTGNNDSGCKCPQIRLHGCRRYASMEGGGRAASGTKVENESGDRVEDHFRFEILLPDSL